MPSAPEAPAKPGNVSVDTHTPLHWLVRCEAVPNADHYRFFRQRPIEDAEPEAVGSSPLPMFVMPKLEAGQLYEVYVTAVNEADSESRLSAPAQGPVLGATAAA